MSRGHRRVAVLVVGGGTTGLALALMLARHRVPCLLVEQREHTSAHPRARGLNPRVMEVMRQLDVETQIRATVSARALAGNDGVLVADSLAGRPLGALRQDWFLGTGCDPHIPSPADWCQCHQNELEPVLLARAQRLGADVRFGTRLAEFAQDGHGVTARLQDRRTGRSETVEAAYLVAADGSRSTVRSALGIPFPGDGPFGTHVNIHFRADLTDALDGRRFIMCYVVNPAVRGALMPLDNRRQWLLHAAVDPHDIGPGGLPAEHSRELVRAAAGLPGLDPEILGAAPWQSQARTAAVFRSGRVLLAGDAAHVMPPSGSFGANTGILDAHNLAWKLASVHHGHAGPALLDSYDAERRPVALATARQAVLRSRDRLRLTDGPGRPADPAIVRDGAVWFGGRCLSPAVLCERPAALPNPESPDFWRAHPGGLPGTRAPHVPIVRGGERLSTLDLFGAAHVLLAGERATAWAADGARAARRLGVPLHVHRVGADGLEAPEDDWHAAHGITPAGAVLVRPDGIVGWRSAEGPGTSGPDLHAVLTALLARGAPAEA